MTRALTRRSAAGLALLLAGCGNAPSSGGDGAPPGDATGLGDGAQPGDGAPDPDANPRSIRLTEVTGALPSFYEGGLADPDRLLGSGAAIGDVDGDGDADVVLARCDAGPDAGGPTTLLRQSGDAIADFEEDAALAATLAGLCAHAATLGDYDRDGDLDLFVAADGPDRLLRNDGAGGFTDVTAAAGVGGPDGDLSTGGVWADVNADGLLDLYVTAQTPAFPPDAHPLAANRLYINQADGTFLDASDESAAAGNGSTHAALFSDLDGDGDIEIYVANDRYAINGAGGVATLDHDLWLDPVGFDDAGVPAYVDRSVELGITGMRSSMGVALADLDGDGVDDLYVTDWGANHLDMWVEGSGAYVDVAEVWNLSQTAAPSGYYLVSWGARFTDFDRDGAEELIVVNGDARHAPEDCQTRAQLDLFLRRRPGAFLFDEVTAHVGLPWDTPCGSTDDIPYSGRGAVLGDLDGDGDDDLVITPYGERFRVYRNDTPQADRHRLRVRPVGTVSAPDPTGAVLLVERSDGTTARRVLYAGGDTASQSDRILEVGLGDTPEVVAATLLWPSGLAQRLDLTPGFALDTEIVAVEPAWLTLSSRVADPGDDPVTLTYIATGASGAPLGIAGAGRTLTATRSDGVAVAFTDRGDGSYVASLPHPGSPRMTVVTVSVDGAALAVRPRIQYR